jgi:hypothetical protein
MQDIEPEMKDEMIAADSDEELKMRATKLLKRCRKLYQVSKEAKRTHSTKVTRPTVNDALMAQALDQSFELAKMGYWTPSRKRDDLPELEYV